MKGLKFMLLPIFPKQFSNWLMSQLTQIVSSPKIALCWISSLLIICSSLIVILGIVVYKYQFARNTKLTKYDKLRSQNPLLYYKDIATLQTSLSNLYTLARLTTDDTGKTTTLYLEEVFTEYESTQKLADKLNDLSKNTNVYWTVIEYKTPIERAAN